MVTECARVREVERLLARGNLANLAAVGQVMTEGHRSTAADYRVSTPAVDELVEHLHLFNLLGDPLLRLRLPEPIALALNTVSASSTGCSPAPTQRVTLA